MIRRALIAAFALASTAALAHHGFTGRYDTDKPIWLAGTVTAVSASPPHPTVTIRVGTEAVTRPDTLPVEFTGALVVQPEDFGRTIQVEFPPVGTFYAIGQSVRVGDKVRIMALRNCRPPHQLRSQWLRLTDDTVIERIGRLSYMARGCEGG